MKDFKQYREETEDEGGPVWTLTLVVVGVSIFP